jgi:hypothetical protein
MHVRVSDLILRAGGHGTGKVLCGDAVGRAAAAFHLAPRADGGTDRSKEGQVWSWRAAGRAIKGRTRFQPSPIGVPGAGANQFPNTHSQNMARHCKEPFSLPCFVRPRNSCAKIAERCAKKCDLFQAFLGASQVDLLQVGERDTRFLHAGSGRWS